MQGLQQFFTNISQFFEFLVVYYSIILGFCALISVLVLGIIMFLRKTVLADRVFAKAASWGLLILCLFCGKLKLIFETKAGWYTLGRWDLLCAHRIVSIIYIVGIFIFAAYFIYRRRRLHKFVKGLDKATTCSFDNEIRKYPGTISPFCIGCIHPIIVIPEKLDVQNALIVIKHEETHIKLGHLWIIAGYDMVRCLLWPNVFLHIAAKYIKRDLEDVCDAVTMQMNGIDPFDYGESLLANAKEIMLSRKNMKCEEGFLFAWDDNYKVLNKRIHRILERNGYDRKVVLAGGILFIMALIASIFGIKCFSYKRNNPLDISGIYSMTKMDTVVQDTEEKIVTGYDGDYIYIDGAALKEAYPDAEIEEQPLFVFVGGYYKIPGVGGGGGWGEFSASDVKDGVFRIENHDDIDVWNWMIMWL
ncbi:BlaR1 peptidase M56 [Butyrivibrio sp. INlla16]|nr:BlaR1 peptidase M56 [Butyrivibrio sp. INlla16]